MFESAAQLLSSAPSPPTTCLDLLARSQLQQSLDYHTSAPSPFPVSNSYSRDFIATCQPHALPADDVAWALQQQQQQQQARPMSVDNELTAALEVERDALQQQQHNEASFGWFELLCWVLAAASASVPTSFTDGSSSSSNGNSDCSSSSSSISNSSSGNDSSSSSCCCSIGSTRATRSGRCGLPRVQPVPITRRRHKRRANELSESERWYCPEPNCPQFYRRSSSVSIRRHRRMHAKEMKEIKRRLRAAQARAALASTSSSSDCFSSSVGYSSARSATISDSSNSNSSSSSSSSSRNCSGTGAVAARDVCSSSGKGSNTTMPDLLLSSSTPSVVSPSSDQSGVSSLCSPASSPSPAVHTSAPLPTSPVSWANVIRSSDALVFASHSGSGGAHVPALSDCRSTLASPTATDEDGTMESLGPELSGVLRVCSIARLALSN